MFYLLTASLPSDVGSIVAAWTDGRGNGERDKEESFALSTNDHVLMFIRYLIFLLLYSTQEGRFFLMAVLTHGHSVYVGILVLIFDV